MGAAYSSYSYSTIPTDSLYSYPVTTAFFSSDFLSNSSKPTFGFNPTNKIFNTHFPKPIKIMSQASHPSPLKSGKVEAMETQEGFSTNPTLDFHGIDQKLVDKMAYDALVWSSLHGLVIGDKSVQVSGSIWFPRTEEKKVYIPFNSNFRSLFCNYFLKSYHFLLWEIKVRIFIEYIYIFS